MDTKKIVALRQQTGVGFADCALALEKANGDPEKAITILREQGALKAAKKMTDRTAKEGIIASYVHAGGSIGVLVEVNCETDFVARNVGFQQFVHEVAMHIAASNPQYVAIGDVPETVIAQERAIFAAQVTQSKKPAAIAEKIIAGKLEQFYREVCLLQQPFIKDDRRTVQQIVEEQVGKLGEKIVIKRFVRFQLGYYARGK